MTAMLTSGVGATSERLNEDSETCCANYARFNVVMAAKMTPRPTVFWGWTPYSSIDICQSSGDT
jgi:hypothetical protein